MKKNFSLIIISLLIIVISGLIIHIAQDDKKGESGKDKIASDTLIHISKSESKDEITYEVVDNAKSLTYSWTFKKDKNLMGALKDNMEIDMDLRLSLLTDLQNKEINDLVENKDKLVISFNHHGELPTKAKIKLDVSDKYKEGEKLYLYYFNEEKHQIEYIQNGLVVTNGKVEFEITHCSNYLLTASIVQDAVNNPKNINLIIIVMVVVIIVLIGATLFQNKK